MFALGQTVYFWALFALGVSRKGCRCLTFARYSVAERMNRTAGKQDGEAKTGCVVRRQAQVDPVAYRLSEPI